MDYLQQDMHDVVVNLDRLQAPPGNNPLSSAVEATVTPVQDGVEALVPYSYNPVTDKLLSQLPLAPSTATYVAVPMSCASHNPPLQSKWCTVAFW